MNFWNIIGWIVLGLIIIGAGIYGYIWWRDKKLFSKLVNVNVIVGSYWKTYFNYDRAKPVKIGSGGFEILYLKKLKTWKIGYGGNVGDNVYDFYIMPDGYWYNGMRYADMNSIDKHGGLIPVITANPLMRGQYTSLEKQIDALHQNKKGWWEQYGNFIMSIAFILIAGVLLWLCYKEYVSAMANLATFSDKLGGLVDKMNQMLSNVQVINSGGTGLHPA